MISSTLFLFTLQLDTQINELKSALLENGILWISYPKQSAEQEIDLNRYILRELLAGKRSKAVSQVSVDDIQPALRFKRL